MLSAAEEELALAEHILVKRDGKLGEGGMEKWILRKPFLKTR